MATTELLREIVSEFFGVGPDEVGPSFSLSGRKGHGSIARAALDSALRRRAGVRSDAVYTARTFAELAAGLGAGADAAALDLAAPGDVRAAATDSKPAGPPVSCGVDIELVENLPEAADYWEHEFYQEHFTPAEIVYCSKQPSPRVHFAARWCAKEAMRKCDPDFAGVAMTSVEVVPDASGAPRLWLLGGEGPRKLPHSVSVSHTNHAAVAVVVAVGPAAPAAPARPEWTPSAAPPTAPVSPRRGFAGTLQGLAAALALTAATLALWKSYH